MYAAFDGPLPRPPEDHPALRGERWEGALSVSGSVGDWEGSPTANYARVWAADEVNPCHAGGDVEPAAAVLDRSTAFIADLERRYSGRDILLVSHGDTLQILRAGFLRMNPSQHRSLPELKTAEIRQLRLDARPPAPAPLQLFPPRPLISRLARTHTKAANSRATAATI